MKFIDLHIAEWLKLRSSLALYFALTISFLLAGMITFVHFLDVHSLAGLNQSPWDLFINRGETVLTAFMIVPFLIFLSLGLYYIEQKADSKKMLYTMPNSRWKLVISKLIIYICLSAIIFLLFGVFMVLGGYILGAIFPEFEFAYHEAPLKTQFSLLVHTLIASLGIIGIQTLLHSIFRSYLLPLVIGITVFMGGFIMSTMNLSFVKYVPYAYPINVRDLNFIPCDVRVLYKGGLFSNLELFSVIVLGVCIILSCILETRKSIH